MQNDPRWGKDVFKIDKLSTLSSVEAKLIKEYVIEEYETYFTSFQLSS
jgi:hypothetical protein